MLKFFSPLAKAKRVVFWHDFKNIFGLHLKKGEPIKIAKLIQKLKNSSATPVEKKIWIENLTQIQGTHAIFAQFDGWLKTKVGNKKLTKAEFNKLKRQFMSEQGISTEELFE